MTSFVAQMTPWERRVAALCLSNLDPNGTITNESGPFTFTPREFQSESDRSNRTVRWFQPRDTAFCYLSTQHLYILASNAPELLVPVRNIVVGGTDAFLKTFSGREIALGLQPLLKNLPPVRVGLESTPDKSSWKQGLEDATNDDTGEAAVIVYVCRYVGYNPDKFITPIEMPFDQQTRALIRATDFPKAMDFLFTRELQWAYTAPNQVPDKVIKRLVEKMQLTRDERNRAFALMAPSLYAKPTFPPDVTLLEHPSSAGERKDVAEQLWTIRESFMNQEIRKLLSASRTDVEGCEPVAALVSSGHAHAIGHYRSAEQQVSQWRVGDDRTVGTFSLDLPR